MLRFDRLDLRRTRSAGPDRRPAWQGQSLARAAGLATRTMLCLVLGTVLGLAITGYVVRHDTGVGAVTIGPWSFLPDAGTPGINPYLHARFAHTGQIPMAAAEGVMFVADRDDRGAKLDRRCSYRIEGGLPRAQYWTIGAVDDAGFPIGNAAGRSAFTSAEILRQAGGHFTIAVSGSPRPGNWLPVAGTGRLFLVLRLYDTAITALSAKELRQLPVPSIVADPCG